MTSASSTDEATDRLVGRVRPYRALAIVPTVCLLAGIPFANRTEPYVLGFPFLLFWIVAWVVATSAVMGLIWLLDRSRA